MAGELLSGVVGAGLIIHPDGSKRIVVDDLHKSADRTRHDIGSAEVVVMVEVGRLADAIVFDRCYVLRVRFDHM